MKDWTRYLIFGGEEYYANGGVYGLITEHTASLKDTISYADKLFDNYIEITDEDGYKGHEHIEWVQVVNASTMKIEYQKGKSYGHRSTVKRVIDKETYERDV